MQHENVFISLVIPAFKEEDVIMLTLNEATRVLETITQDYEIVAVDDGSTDMTFTRVMEAHQANNRIKGLKFSRNFGKEAAMLAGMARARGQVVVTMDGDLQHPPGVIPEMVEKWRKGAQIVHGVKQTRQYGGLFHRTFARLFYGLFSKIAGFKINNSSDFKLLDAKIASLLVRDFPEQQRFLRGLSCWVGYRQESVTFEVSERPVGESRWGLSALFRYGWNSLTSYTSLPLQLVPFMGVIMLLISVILGTEALVSRLRGESITGFATLEITMLFSGSMIMIGLGIVGQYLARVYDELKKRPTFLVADEVGFEPSTPAASNQNGVIR